MNKRILSRPELSKNCIVVCIILIGKIENRGNQSLTGIPSELWSKKQAIPDIMDSIFRKYSRVLNKTGGNFIISWMFFPPTCPYLGLLV